MLLFQVSKRRELLQYNVSQHAVLLEKCVCVATYQCRPRVSVNLKKLVLPGPFTRPSIQHFHCPVCLTQLITCKTVKIPDGLEMQCYRHTDTRHTLVTHRRGEQRSMWPAPREGYPHTSFWLPIGRLLQLYRSSLVSESWSQLLQQRRLSYITLLLLLQ